MTQQNRAHLEQVLQCQRDAHLLHPYPCLAERRQDLLKLQAFVRDNAEAIADAIHADYGHRSRHETMFAEVVPVIQGVKHALKHLAEWMRPQKRGVDWLNFFGVKNRVLPQPLGVIGIIVPWNFPVNLSFMVLIDAFAAGNRAMVKMSENSRHLTQLLIDKSPLYFSNDKLIFIDETGGIGETFSHLKFDHLVFTGSSQTGRAVMAAAAQNLCPVTLELGGKSPAVVCEDFLLRKAAEHILFAKCFNAGQICTSVDHLYLPQHQISEFVETAKEIVQKRFTSLESVDYSSIIDARSFHRLIDALQEAKAQGATLIPLLKGKPWDEETRKIAPHVVLNMPQGCALQVREIFGPILPVIAYTSLDDVVIAINNMPTPLAFYAFSHDEHVVSNLVQRIRSGGVAINDALFHAAQHSLPFGGVGESGMGHYHGYDGFVTFSKMRPIFYQARISGMRIMWPPYGKLATKYLGFLLK
jgi:coniferyl-aldehyde dehydrogenase